MVGLGLSVQQGKLLAKTPAEFSQQIVALNEQLSEQIRESCGRFSAEISVSWAKVAEGMRRFAAGFPEQTCILAQNGWFISSWHTPLAASIYRVAHLFKTGSITEGHKLMCVRFSRIRQRIEDNLTNSFPKRRRILQKAFQAHDAGDYELSVPVFLAQADGIAAEILGVSFYSRDRNKVREMGQKIKRIATDGLNEFLLNLALEEWPLTASPRSPVYRQGELNRHEVLHGIDTHYAKELNSFRAMSRLQYAALFYEAKKCSDQRSKKVE